MKGVKGEIAEIGTLRGGDMADQVTEKATKGAIRKIRSTLIHAIRDMDIEIDDAIRHAVETYMDKWLRTMVSEQAYVTAEAEKGKLKLYVSAPLSDGSETDPGWYFDLGKILSEWFDLEKDDTTPLTAKGRAILKRNRDALQRLVTMYDNHLEKRT